LSADFAAACHRAAPPLRLMGAYAGIRRNAGIYNGIVAVGLFVASSVGPDAFHVQVALLTGGVVAGLFGAATLTKATIVQAVFGAIALVIVMWFRA
jgi:uncharacterized membrane protein